MCLVFVALLVPESARQLGRPRQVENELMTHYRCTLRQEITSTILQQKITARFFIFGQELKNTETDTAIIPGWREFGINYSDRNSNNSLCVRLRRGSKMIWFTDI